MPQTTARVRAGSPRAASTRGGNGRCVRGSVNLSPGPLAFGSHDLAVEALGNLASSDHDGRRPIDGLLDLQRTVGNRTVVELLTEVGRGRPGVQRLPRVQRQAGESGEWQPEGAQSSSIDDPFATVPADIGKDAGQMSWKELEDAIDYHEEYFRARTSTSFDDVKRKRRLDALVAAQRKLAAKAAGTAGPGGGRRQRRRKGSKPKTMPARPESLEGSVNWAERREDARIELDKIVAYLAAGPSRAERQILEAELPYIEEAAGVARAQGQAERRREQLAAVLAPTKGDEADQLIELLKRLEKAERLPGDEGIWLIHHDGQVFPLAAEELVEIKRRVADGLLRGASAVNNFIGDIELAFKERHARNKKQWVVHGLVKFATGARDIPPRDIAEMVKTGRFFVGRVRDRGRAGALVLAGNDLLYFDGYARYWGDKVGQWESTLVKGAGRWVIALTVLKEALSIMAGFGAARLATIAGGGSVIGTFKAGAKVATMTTGTGLVTGGVSAAVADRDVGGGIRAGGGAGFGVGANALTAGVGKIASVGDAAKATTRAGKAYAVGKAVVLEAGANVATNVTQAAIEGGDKSDAALGALASSPISTLGGGVVDKLAKSKAASTVGKTIVGSGSGVAGAAASGGDVTQAALVGAGGGLHGGLASPGPDVGPKPSPADQAAQEAVPGGALSAPAAAEPVPAAASAVPAGPVAGAPTPEGGAIAPTTATPAGTGGPRPLATAAGGTAGAGPGPSVADLARTWRQPDVSGFREAATVDDAGVRVHKNVTVHPDLDVDLAGMLVELDRTPWGSRIADRIRNGEMELVVMKPGADFPFGGLHYAGGKTYIAWRGDVRETVSNAVHEGSHNLDPAAIRSGSPRGPSNLGVEAEARAFEYEYNEQAGLAPRQPAEEDYRAAYRRIEIETAGTHPITPDNPFGADLRRARIEADKAMIAAMRADPDRYAVETRAQEGEAIASHRAPGLRDVPAPGTAAGSPRPTPARPTPPLGFTPVPDTGLVGDEQNPARRAEVVPRQDYEAAARPLTSREAADITTAQARVRADIQAELANVENGRTSGADFDEFTRVIAALRLEPGSGTNQLVLDHAQTVWDAVHDPALIAQVVSELYGESLRRPGSGALDPLTQATLRAAASSGPIHVVPPAQIGDVSFFRHWVATGRRFLDMGVGEDHGNLAHLLQDLVVDRALQRSRAGITAQQYRQALGLVQIAGTRPGPYAPGESLWRVTFDGANSVSTPEDLMEALRKVPGLEKLR